MLRKMIIKTLGGHTDSEYRRLEQKYDALLLEHSDNGAAVMMTNEYQFRLLSDLDRYMKSLWNNPTDLWAFNTYKVVHDNLMFLMTNMPQGKVKSPYRLKLNPFAVTPKDLSEHNNTPTE